MSVAWGSTLRSSEAPRRDHPLVVFASQLLLLASPLALLELGRATVDVFGLERCAPDWIAAGVAFAALRASPGSACVWAATAGLLEDVPAGGPFGLGGARRALLAALVQACGRELDLGSPLLRPLAAALVAFADKALLALEIAFTTEGGAPLAPLLAQGALVALATAVVTPLLWSAAELVSGRGASRRGAS